LNKGLLKTFNSQASITEQSKVVMAQLVK